jgi:hypothetical protein
LLTVLIADMTESEAESLLWESDDNCMEIALRLTYGIPDILNYDVMLDEDYVFEESPIIDSICVEETRDTDDSDDDVRVEIVDHTDHAQVQEKSTLATNEMHIAVFRYDVEAVEALLRHKPVEYWDRCDERKNTPLLLAVKLGHINLSRMLIAQGFSCDCSSFQNSFEYHLIDEAVLTSSVPLVQDIYREMQRLGWKKWLSKKDLLLDCVEKIPDFYIELKWNFSGVGPMGGVVKKFAPDDTYRIWKRGSWLRLDSTIAGFNTNFSVKRSPLSLIFRGRGAVRSTDVPSDGEGDLLLLDRSDMTYQRVCDPGYVTI